MKQCEVWSSLKVEQGSGLLGEDVGEGEAEGGTS